MKQWMKRVVALLLTTSMLLSLCVTTTFAVDTGKTVEVSTSMQEVTVRADDSQQIYKLVVSAYSQYGLSTMSTIFSYDNSLIVPVNQYASYADFAIDGTGVQVGAAIGFSLRGTDYQLYSLPSDIF